MATDGAAEHHPDPLSLFMEKHFAPITTRG